MADTVDKKTYLINVQDNLEVYAQHAEDAAQEVARLTIENEQLKESSTATGAQIEKSNAALRVAVKEYGNAKKNVELATKANVAHKNSYEELLRRWQLAQTQLKLMGDGFTTNAKGVRVLSTEYQKQSKVVADAKRSLDQFGKGVRDNRLNVGSYGEAISEAFGNISPKLAQAQSGLKQFIGAAGKLGGIGALIAGTIAALGAPLIAFFTKSEEGVDSLQRKVAGLRAAVGVLVGDLIRSGEKVNAALEPPSEEASRFWQKFFLIFNQSLLVTGARMDAASDAAQAYTAELQRLEDQERSMIVPRAEASLKIKEARMLFDDENQSIEVRIAGLARALQLEQETADAEVKHQQEVIAQLRIVNAEKKKAGQLRDSDLRALEVAIAKEIELRTDSVGRQLRANRTLQNSREQLTKDAIDQAEREAKALRDFEESEQKASFEGRKLLAKNNTEAMIAVLQEELEAELAATDIGYNAALLLRLKFNEAVQKLRDEDAKAAKETAEKNAKAAKEDLEAGLELQRIQAQGNLNILEDILDEEYAALLASAEFEALTQNQKLLAEAQYTEAKRELSRMRITQAQDEYALVADALGAISGVLGRETTLGKAFAVAQATINTYLAATQALRDPTLVSTAAKIAAMVTIIGAGLANVRNILQVDTSGGSAGGGAATALSSSPAVTRITAPVVGASALAPTQSAAAVGAAALGSGLTAEGIAAALANLPRPVVTVEDINARTKDKQRVEVAARI